MDYVKVGKSDDLPELHINPTNVNWLMDYARGVMLRDGNLYMVNDPNYLLTHANIIADLIKRRIVPEKYGSKLGGFGLAENAKFRERDVIADALQLIGKDPKAEEMLSYIDSNKRGLLVTYEETMSYLVKKNVDVDSIRDGYADDIGILMMQKDDVNDGDSLYLSTQYMEFLSLDLMKDFGGIDKKISEVIGVVVKKWTAHMNDYVDNYKKIISKEGKSSEINFVLEGLQMYDPTIS